MSSSIYIGFGVGTVVYCGFVDRSFTRQIESRLHPNLGNQIADSLISLAIGWSVLIAWPIFLVWLIAWSLRQ